MAPTKPNMQTAMYSTYKAMGYEYHEEQPRRGWLVMRRGDEYISINKAGRVRAGNALGGS